MRRYLSPASGMAALIVLWLPWVRIECGSARAAPSLWQLADQEPRLYAYAVIAALLLAAGLLGWFGRRRAWSAGALFLALTGTAAWIYLLLKKQSLVRHQAAVAGMGGRLGEWFSDLEISPAPGFYLYLAAMLLGALAALWDLLAPGPKQDARAGRP